MSENENLNVDNNGKEESSFSIRKIVGYLRSYWKLFLLSFAVCMLVAYVYLRQATPIYNVTAKVLLQDSEKGGAIASPADMLADFGMQSQTSNIENEMELMSSMAVVRGAVIDAHFNVKYTSQGKSLNKKTTPLLVSMDEEALSELVAPLSLEFNVEDGDKVHVSYTCNEKSEENVLISAFPYVLKTPKGEIVIERNEKVTLSNSGLSASILPVNNNIVGKYNAGLSIAPLSKTASVAVLSFNTPFPSEGVDFLNSVMTSFNKVTNDKKRETARKTLEFIDERLAKLRLELEEMEGNLAEYKMENELIDPKLDVTQVSQKKAEYVKMLEQVDLKIRASKNLNSFVNNPKKDMQLIPTSFGVELDPALVTLINNYNSKVLERKALLHSTTDENPALKSATSVVRDMKEELRVALKGLDEALATERKEIAKLASKYTNRFEKSPEVERLYNSLTRELAIKSDLYVMLLQKREETELSVQVTSDNLSCIDAPSVAGVVSPKNRMVYLIALCIALLLPIAYIYIRVKMRNKFDTAEEIQDVLDISCMGSIPIKNGSKENPKPIVVEKNVNDVMAEAFRTLRTNLQFVTKRESGNVLMFTSTISGEGKTFIASNLAVSTALLGKKVLLIGCDIRRPRLAEVFNFSSDCSGLTSYLAAPEDEVAMLDGLIIPSDVVDGLDLLPAGIVPPNPAELLSGNNMDRAIEYLKTKYDYIILDAAPAGLVTDPVIVSRVVDTVLYVMRLNYTHKADAEFIASLVDDKKLRNVSIVVNGENLSAKTYGTRGSHRYSSYGYSYLDSKKKKNAWWKKWF